MTLAVEDISKLLEAEYNVEIANRFRQHFAQVKEITFAEATAFIDKMESESGEPQIPHDGRTGPMPSEGEFSFDIS